MNKTVIASTFALVIACASWPALAKDEAAGGNRVASGAKLTKADAARSAQGDAKSPGGVIPGAGIVSARAATGRTAQPQRPTGELKGETEDETTGRRTENKDIRRGAVIAKPGASSPHSTQPAPSEQGAGGQPEQRAGHGVHKTKHDTVKNSISNIR